jgi:hypothetical protein
MTSHIQKIKDRAMRTRQINNPNDKWFVHQNDPNGKNKRRIKSSFLVNSVLLCLIVSLISSCAKDDPEYVTLQGRVVRDVTGEGIPNQRVLLTTNQPMEVGNRFYSAELDKKEVITDANGDFRMTMKSCPDYFVSVYKFPDDTYQEFFLQNSRKTALFDANHNLILRVDKFLKYKIHVQNTAPVDTNDYVDIDIFSGLQESRTKIENFGSRNTLYPADGDFGAREETSWKGPNVQSIIYYNVPESSSFVKLMWTKRKKGIQSSGFSEELPQDPDQVNAYQFNY